MALRSCYDDFVIEECIGNGSFGTVFKVLRKADGLTYAMKEIDLAGMSRKEQAECIQESRILAALDSPHIIQYYDAFLENGCLCLITEYATNGNLHDFLADAGASAPLDEPLIWKIFAQITCGLAHMHSKKILHRDV